MAIVAIDGRKYFDYGIGTYVQQLVGALSELQTAHQFILFVNPGENTRINLPDGWTKEDAPYGKYSFGEVLLFGLKSKRVGVDVFHEPHYTLPIGLGKRSLTTIHDVTHLRFPEFFSLPKRTYSFLMIQHALRDSQFVSTGSEFTKLDILKTFRVEEDKIKVIPLGVGRQFKPARNEPSLDEFRERFGLHRRFILYVGNILPHKGIQVLLRSFRDIECGEDIDLVLVGGSIKSSESLQREATELGIQKSIKELGKLADSDLVMAYNGAEMLVMPSLYEGFGLPALEAMACGTPVIVSRAGSLPEVAGEAALLFRTGDSGALTDAIRTLLREPATRASMVQKGLQHVKKFTWEKAAGETLALYDRIAGN